MLTPANHIQCDMRETCASSASHLDDQGFVYCAHHATWRRRSRALQGWEQDLIRRGETLPSYKPISYTTYLKRQAKGA